VNIHIWRDDTHHCAQLRLGEAHPQHEYTYYLLGGDPSAVAKDLRGLTWCPGLLEPVKPSPERPAPKIAECRCVVSCTDDPATACSLSGEPHVHPDDGADIFGRCPIHPDAPGDL